MKRVAIFLIALLVASLAPQSSMDAEGVEEARLKLILLNADGKKREEKIALHLKTAVKKVQRLHGNKIKSVAKKERFNPLLIVAVVAVESAGDTRAKSVAGAKGLMQLRPPAAREVGVNSRNLYHPVENLIGGTRYLKRLRRHYRFSTLDRVLLAYNHGPEEARKLIKAGRNPATSDYVKRVKLALHYAAKH